MADPDERAVSAENMKAHLRLELRTAVANFHLLGADDMDQRIYWMEKALGVLDTAEGAEFARGVEATKQLLIQVLIQRGSGDTAFLVESLKVEDKPAPDAAAG